ncbi:MAG: hypothetical protein BGP14_04140 [Sphingobacteriales bacterium 44-15]|nr:MAG: hypothetical protein BGP14_04140 [Sphingobacteriales bacterium 44-15]
MHKRYFLPRYRECRFAAADCFERRFDGLMKRKRVTEGKRAENKFDNYDNFVYLRKVRKC